MKIYVGIDITKLNHFTAAIFSNGEIILAPFKFTNDTDGFQLLVSKLESFDKNSYIIHHFSNPNKLLAFTGLNPSVYQSGNFQAKITRMFKHGSRVLRYALVNVA